MLDSSSNIFFSWDDFALEVGRMGYTYNKIKEKLRNSITKTSSLTIWKSQSELYPNVYTLVRALLVLLYTSVQVERVFSTMKNIVNIKRNRLTVENVEACLLGYQASKSESFCITDDMVNNYISNKKVVKVNKSKSCVAESFENTLVKEATGGEKEKKPEINDVSTIKNYEDSDNGEDEDEICQEALLVKFERNQVNELKRSITGRNQGI